MWQIFFLTGNISHGFPSKIPRLHPSNFRKYFSPSSSSFLSRFIMCISRNRPKIHVFLAVKTLSKTAKMSSTSLWTTAHRSAQTKKFNFRGQHLFSVFSRASRHIAQLSVNAQTPFSKSFRAEISYYNDLNILDLYTLH